MIFQTFLLEKPRSESSFTAIGKLHIEWLHCRFPMGYNHVSVLAWPLGYLFSVEACTDFAERADKKLYIRPT